MRLWPLCFLLLGSVVLASAQDDPPQIKALYSKHEYRIPMRDGVKLFTAVYVPKDKSKTYPFLITRTPYSVSPYGEDNYPRRLGPSEDFTRSGYIFVYQDVRGRYMSEGKWLEMTPHRDDKKAKTDVDESSDTYDTIEWLLHHVPNNNGKAGITGISYPGFYAAAGMIDAHPALKAASPQAPIIDLFQGDDSYHNGAFYLAANLGFYTFFGEQKEPAPPQPRSDGFDFGTPDAYDFYLRLGSLANADEKIFRFKNPYWTELLKHTSYDDFWKARNLEPHIKNLPPAVLVVGGWYDAEDLQGPLRLYRASLKSANSKVSLVMGPWVHGGWARGGGESLGAVQFNMKSSQIFQSKVQFPFFEHWLKDAPDPQLPSARVFETGTNQWRSFDQWPPANAQKKKLYFLPGGKLGFEPPSEANGADQYLSDPNRPVPFTSFITDDMAREYMVDDQRNAARRPDVLVYQTEPLTENITVAGPVAAKLWASTSGTDSDWVVKLIDVYPGDAPDPDPNPREIHMGGYQQLLRGEPFRGRFWKGMSTPTPLPSNEFVKIEYVMPDILHTFRRGHRIMIQVQSSWFPLTDRNPQKFVPSIPEAKPEDFITATQRIARSSSQPSGVEVTVLP